MSLINSILKPFNKLNINSLSFFLIVASFAYIIFSFLILYFKNTSSNLPFCFVKSKTKFLSNSIKLEIFTLFKSIKFYKLNSFFLYMSYTKGDKKKFRII